MNLSSQYKCTKVKREDLLKKKVFKSLKDYQNLTKKPFSSNFHPVQIKIKEYSKVTNSLVTSNLILNALNDQDLVPEKYENKIFRLYYSISSRIRTELAKESWILIFVASLIIFYKMHNICHLNLKGLCSRIYINHSNLLSLERLILVELMNFEIWNPEEY